MLDTEDRQQLLAFLSANSDESYAPQSGQIVGILKQLKENMSKSLEEATATEEASITEHEGLLAAKEKEVKALTTAVETKTARSGELAVAAIQLESSLTDTEAALAD